MAKGVKRIKWTGKGKVISDQSVPNKKVAIHPDGVVSFEVDLWHDGTTKEDKKKSMTWILQDRKKQKIVRQLTLAASIPFEVNIPKYLCGPFEYYLEASLSGKRDIHNVTGLLISGSTPAKLVDSKWSQTQDGEDVRKKHFFSYGEKVFLKLNTEGLNGHKNIKIEIFRHLDFKTDPIIRTIHGVEVIDGEINLEIKNTFSWSTTIKGIKEIEQFYIKIYDPVTKVYITDEKNLKDHATFLRIKKQTVSHEVKPPTNLSPLKTGKPETNKVRHELCKFETISITEKKKTPKLLFNNGQNLGAVSSPKTPINKTILFDFEKYEITPDAQTTLNNVLQYLLGSDYSTIKIDGHACVIGKGEYNQKLSQQRSDAVKKIFVDGGLDSRRIISTGRGEVNPTDDKHDRDNIKHKSEKEYIENRRVDISFDSFGHDAQTIVYETIVPSHVQDITIDITEYQNKACLKDVKHQKNIRISSPEYSTPINKVTNKLDFPVQSDLSWLNPAPLQYIWPKYNLTNIASAEKSMDSANNYSIHIHSCRYFSNDANTTILLKAYPDIKWAFEFFLNLTNDLSVKWQTKNEFDVKELQKKSGKIGAERRWKQKDASFGFSLKAKWDDDKQTKELKQKYETKFKKFYDLFASIGALADGVTSKTKGTISDKVSKSIPASFIVKPPNLSFTGDWFLSHPKDNDKIVGTDVTIGLHAKPLIGLEVTIDLLGALIIGAAGVISGGTAIKGVADLYNLIQKTLKKGIKAGDEKNGLSASVDIYMDLIITNTITIDADFKFNTAGKAKDSKFKLEADNKLKVELKVGVKIKGEAAVVIIKVKAYFEASASAEASVTFGHGITYDDKGLYYRPKIGFDGMDAKYVVKISISLAMKIAKDKKAVEETRNSDYTIAEGTLKSVIPPFDVIAELEKLFDINANIPLIKNN